MSCVVGLFRILAISLLFSGLLLTSVAAVQHNSSDTSCKKASYNDLSLIPDRESIVEDKKHTQQSDLPRVANKRHSGLKGKVRSRMVSGMPGGQMRSRPISMEFAIAPIENDQPVYSKAIVVKSDVYGNYEVVLPPGTYWVGPKAKALDPTRYSRQALLFPERRVKVQEGLFTRVDLLQSGYAP